MTKSSFWFCIVFFFSWTLVLCEDVANCGGFVKPAPSIAKFVPKNIDYSNVQLSLMTLQGHTKYTTECTPNGYYVIPVYDPGSYKIRITHPKGWNFEPIEAVVTIGDDRRCNNGHDINFHITGFQLSGKVDSDSRCKKVKEEESKGVFGVKITLRSTLSSEQSRTIATTTTDENGIYTFFNVFPDTYMILAEHPSWSFAKNWTTTTVTWGNVEVPETLIVSGYDVRGIVKDQTQDGDPVEGVELLLYGDFSTAFNSCSRLKDYPPSFQNRTERLLCAVKSDAKGEFVFSNVPCGNYTLIPYYRGTQTTFDVLPMSLPIRVNRGSVVLSRPFLVKGFSISGRVVNSKNEGIEGVNVTMSKTLKSVLTDHNGIYKFDQVTSDTYTFTATKEHYVFSNALTNVKVTPNIGTLPDITVSKYDICGRVLITAMPSSILTTNKRQILLKSEYGPEMTTFTDISGYYCFQVPPRSGKYKVIPIVTKEEAGGGLLLTPQELTVTIDDSPFLEANFAQTKFTVSGRVRCIEIPCTHSISVFLYPLGHDEDHMTTGLAPNSLLDNRAANVDYFVFKDVLPGKYEVKIEQQGWCWIKDSFIIEITKKDVSDIEFVQRGYLMIVESSHNVTIELRVVTDNHHDRQTLTIKKGLNQHCVNKSGVYEIVPVATCFKFDRDVYIFDTSTPLQSIKMSVVSQIVTGLIVASEKTNDIFVDVIVNGEKKTTLPAIFEKKEENKYIYRFSYNDAQPQQVIVFQPNSSKLFFYPRTRNTTVITLDECSPPLSSFEARPGLVLKGKITPPLEGVDARVVSGSNYDEIVLDNIKTNKNGEYQAGPLYDDRSYKVLVSKEGFHFKEDSNSPGNFRMIKLSHVTVIVKDERDNSSLSGVLLSLSGENYRNNNLTNHEGSFRFINLFPGQYYLKPLLKEYAFEPSAKALEVKEGVEMQVIFKAKRVAFSCFGMVRSLNNSTEPFVGIEAISIASAGENGTGNEYEETQSDNNGNYRLRGLIPGKQYHIRVKPTPSGSNIERATPSFYHVVVNNDIHNVNFVVFRKTTRFDLTGIVNVTDRSLLSYIKVELSPLSETTESSFSETQAQEYEATTKSSETRIFQLGPNNFFEFSNLSPQKYLIRLKTNLDPNIYTAETIEQEVEITQHTNIMLNFVPKLKQTNEEARPVSFLVLVFVVVVAVIGYNYKTVLNLVKNWYLKEKLSSSQQQNEWLSHLSKQRKHKQNRNK